MTGRGWPLWVLLGGDYSGKSAVLTQLQRRGLCRVVSCDAQFLPEVYSSVEPLRRVFLDSVWPHVNGMPTPEFVLTGLQMATVYLRDWAQVQRAQAPTLVDSYYYKILAKCAQSQLTCERTLATWRAYPKPDEVIYLCVSPEVAWQRARSLGGHHAFETEGELSTANAPSRFRAFQTRIDEHMRQEVKSVCTTFVDANRPLDEVVADVVLWLTTRTANERRSNGPGHAAAFQRRQA